MNPSETVDIPKPVAAAIDEAVPDELQSTAHHIVKAMAKEAQQRPILAILIAALAGYAIAAITS